MHKGEYVFSKLLDFLDRNDFNYLAWKYGGDKYVKQFTCYNQMKRTRSTTSTGATTTSSVFTTLKALEPTLSSEERQTMTSDQ